MICYIYKFILLALLCCTSLFEGFNWWAIAECLVATLVIIVAVLLGKTMLKRGGWRHSREGEL